MNCKVEHRASMQISSNGRRLLTGTDNGLIRLWDLSASDPSFSDILLRGHQEKIRRLGFSPNSRWLISLDEDSMVRLWPLHADQLLDLARRTAGRNLSPEELDQDLPGLPYHKTSPENPGSLAGQTSARKAKERAFP